MKTLSCCFEFLTICDGILAILFFLSLINVKLSLIHFFLLSEFLHQNNNIFNESSEVLTLFPIPMAPVPFQK